MPSHFRAVLVLLSLLLVSAPAFGKAVFFKDGALLECESFRQQGGEVVVKVNRDVLLRFPADEINISKTFGYRVNRTKISAPRHAGAKGTAQPVSAKVEAKPSAPAVQGPAASVPSSMAVGQNVDKGPSQKSEAPAPAAPAEEASTIPAPVPIEALGAVAMGSMVAYIVAVLLLLLVMLVANYRIFEKAGESGWKSLVPIYNLYIMIKIAGKPGWWLLLMLVPIVSFVILLLTMIALAHRFGKGTLFGVGLFLLNIIFFPVLAFDGSTYEPASA